MNLFDLLNQVPGEIAWKDKNFCYLGCNLNRAAVIGFEHPDAIIGLSDNELQDQTQESVSFHHRHDQMALEGEVIRTIHPSAVKDDQIAYYQIKKPLLENGEIIGIIYHCNEFVRPDFFHHLNKLDQKYVPEFCLTNYYEIEPDNNLYKLTTRELECIFCLLRGMSASEAGQLIGISKRTVEFYIENIKNKLNCDNKAQVIVKAIEANYIQIIPNRFTHVDWKEFL